MTPPAHRTKKGFVRARFSRWVWMLAILLVACTPITPPAELESETPNPVMREEDRASVAILVVDFFGHPQTKPVASAVDNCLGGANGFKSSPVGGSSGSTGVITGMVSSTLSHGDLVYSHLHQQFPTTTTTFQGVPLPEIDINGLITVEIAETPAGNIYLAQIDVGGAYTDEALEQIREVRDWLSTLGVKSFVANLSVIVTSCESDPRPESATIDELMDRFAEIRCVPEIADHLAILRNLPLAAANQYAFNFLQPRLDAFNVNSRIYNVDSYLRFAAPQCPEQVMPVPSNQIAGNIITATETLTSLQSALPNTYLFAASGNDGSPYPYIPALLPRVVSVGASDHEMNRAEWVTSATFDWEIPEGQRAQIAGENLNGQVVVQDLNPGDSVSLYGTSFSTPKLSYLAATAILHGLDMPSCYPNLTYAAEEVRNILASNSSVPVTENIEEIWENRSIDQITEACPDFVLPR